MGRVAAAVEGGGDGGVRRRGGRREGALVVEERAHVQDVVLAARAEARAQLLEDRPRVAHVAGHRAEGHARLAQRPRRRQQRRLVEVDAHHQQRLRVQVRAAPRPLAHVPGTGEG